LERQQQALQLQAEAAALSKDVILTVLRDSSTLDTLVDLLLTAVSDKRTKAALVDFLRERFLEDPETKEALRAFVLDAVIKDDWVKDDLIEIAKRLGLGIIDDKRVWPEQVLETLNVAALDGLRSDQFKDATKDLFVRALWGAVSPTV
jgi:hypothetical protein